VLDMGCSAIEEEEEEEEEEAIYRIKGKIFNLFTYKRLLVTFTGRIKVYC